MSVILKLRHKLGYRGSQEQKLILQTNREVYGFQLEL